MGGNRLKLLNLIVCTRSSGAAVTFLYISVKILYTVNIVGQIFLLNTFLGNRSRWYGLQVSARCLHSVSESVAGAQRFDEWTRMGRVGEFSEVLR